MIILVAFLEHLLSMIYFNQCDIETSFKRSTALKVIIIVDFGENFWLTSNCTLHYIKINDYDIAYWKMCW